MLAYGAFDGINGNDNDIMLHYWSLSGKDDGGEAKIAQGAKGADTNVLMEEAEAGLKALVTHFMNEDAPYLASPDPRITMNSDYNDFAHLERMAEWSVVEGEAEE